MQNCKELRVFTESDPWVIKYNKSKAVPVHMMKGEEEV